MSRRLFTGGRHVLRGLAMALAALSLAWGITFNEGLLAAMVGALLGVAAGELLGRSRLRLPVLLVGLVGLVLLVWQGAGLSVGTEFVPGLVGPGNALVFAGVLRFGSAAFGVTSVLRALAVRRPAATALELGFLVASITTVFASHRDGVIARPLWLSDWAFRNSIDPAHVLLAIGGLAVVILAVLLVVETRSGRSISSLVALLALAALAVVCLNVKGLPTPQPANDLGLTNPPPGEEPRTPPPDAGHGPDNHHGPDGGGSGHDQGDGGQGQGPGADASDNDGTGGGAGQDGNSADGGTSGEGADASADGGGASGSPDGGDDTSGGMPPPEENDGSVGQAPPPQGDGGAQHTPPPSEQLSEDQSPSNSPAPMAIVLLDDDYSPPAQAYYFRQEVWSQYNGTRLVRTTRTDADGDTLDDFPTESTPVRDPPAVTGRARVHATVAMLVEHTHPFALETAVRFLPTGNPNPERFVRAYRFESLAQSVDYRRLVGHPAGDHRWSPDVRSYYLQGPSDPRYAALAHQIVQTRLPARLRAEPFAEALAVKAYLDHELIYSTSRQYRHAGMADPTADFLFGNRTGYCVHFAHSAVYLWRALGIPARISTGYHSDEDNRHGGSTILLRGGDAHAWPELYIDGYGWIVLDIAAERNLDPPGNPPDEDLQRRLGEMARHLPPTPTEPPRMQRPPRPHYGRDLGYLFLAMVGGTLAVLYAVKLWRRLAPVFASAKSLPRVGYRKALDLLAEAGLRREYGETREDFARRVAKVSPSFGRLTAMHMAARLGNPAADLANRAEFVSPEPPSGGAPDTRRPMARVKSEVRGAVRAVARDLAGTTKRWRRWLGWLNPASFLDAR